MLYNGIVAVSVWWLSTASYYGKRLALNGSVEPSAVINRNNVWYLHMRK